MTPTPPHFDPNPTRYDPADHSVSDMEIPAELRRPQPPPVQDRRPWWVCLLGFVVRLILRRKGG